MSKKTLTKLLKLASMFLSLMVISCINFCSAQAAADGATPIERSTEHNSETFSPGPTKSEESHLKSDKLKDDDFYDDEEDNKGNSPSVRASHLKVRVIENKELYKNAPMAFSTLLPEGAEISELGERSMRAFLPKQDRYLSFSAASQEVSAQVDLAWFFKQVIQHLPPNWKVIRQESTTVDGNPGYALEADEANPGGSTYRQRIYAMRRHKILIFDVSCPMQSLKTNNQAIKNIWTNLHLSD